MGRGMASLASRVLRRLRIPRVGAAIDLPTHAPSARHHHHQHATPPPPALTPSPTRLTHNLHSSVLLGVASFVGAATPLGFRRCASPLATMSRPLSTDAHSLSAALKQARSLPELRDAVLSVPEDSIHGGEIARAWSILARMGTVDRSRGRRRREGRGSASPLSGEEAALVVQLLERKAVEGAAQLDPRSLSIMCHSVVNLARYPDELFQNAAKVRVHDVLSAAAAVAVPRLSEFSARDLARLLRAFAVAGQAGGFSGLFFAAEDAICGKDQESARSQDGNGAGVLASGNGHDITNMAWALGKAGKSSGHRFDDAFGAIARRATSLVQQRDAFTGQQLASLAATYAAALCPAPELFSALCTAAIERLDEFSPQGLATLLWAFVKLDRFGESGMNHGRVTAVDGSVPPSSQRKGSEMRKGPSSSLDALSTAIERHIVEQRAAQLESFQSHALSTLLWALAAAGRRDEQVFDVLGKEIVRREFNGFNARDIACTVGGLATARQFMPDLFSCLADVLVRRKDLSTFSPHALSTTLWAYATLRHRCPPLFDAAATAILRDKTTDAAVGARGDCMLSSFRPHDTSIALWAFAALSQPAPHLFDSARSHIIDAAFFHGGAGAPSSKSDRWSTRQISMTLWAYAVFDRADAALVRTMTACIPEVNRKDVAHGLHPVVATQLFQVGLSARRNENDERRAVMPPALEDAARAHWSAQTARGSQRSRFQQAVASAARRLGLPVTYEWVTPDGLFSVDLMLEVSGGPLAVEVNGPLHYSINLDSDGIRSPLGATALRLRLLAPHLGGRLVSVPFFEWNRLQNDEEQELYLLERIKPYL